jgi:sugar phosphate permease
MEQTTDGAIVRDRLARWRALTVALLAVGYGGYYLCRSNLSVTAPLILQEMTSRGESSVAARMRLGAIASVGVLAYAAGKFASGTLADRFGGRSNFLIGMAGSILFTLLLAVSGSLPFFTLAWAGNRLIQSLGWAGAVKITSRWFPFSRYGAAMAIVSLSFLFGDAAARRFMALLIAGGMGWRGVFGVAAAVLAGLLVPCLLFLRESPADIGEVEPRDNPASLFSQTAEAPKDVRSLLQPFLRSGPFWLVCVLSLGTTILRETFSLWTPAYFTEAVSMNAADAASNSALFPLFGGASVLLCGWLSDRLGRGGRAVLMTLGLGAAAFVLAALGFGMVRGSPIWNVIFVSLIAFLIIGPYSLLAGAMSLDFGGKQASGTASGLIDGVGYLGAILAGGPMARVSVSYGWNGAFGILALIAFLCGGVALLFGYQNRPARPVSD